jgi:hypothetical protein
LRVPAPPRYTVVRPTRAGVAELADAKVSKTFGRKPVGVRFPLPARYILMGGASQQAADGGTSSEGIGWRRGLVFGKIVKADRLSLTDRGIPGNTPHHRGDVNTASVGGG